MKVFEVRYETDGADKKIIDICEFCTADTLQQVTDHYTKFCEEYDHDLKLVREVLVIVRDLRDAND
jgi:hypothetical protein